MLNRIKRLLPHAAVLICNMYIVFFLIDRVNSAMNFIDNRLTKGLLLILCVVSWFNCRELMRSAAPRRPAQRPVEYGRPRRAQDTYGGYNSPRTSRDYAPRYGTSSYRAGDDRRYPSRDAGYGERRTSSAAPRYGERRTSASPSRYGEGRSSDSTSRFSEERYR